jgi:membrane associated rhomboid family serine protease
MPDALTNIQNLPAPLLLIGSVVIISLWAWIFKPAYRWLILIPYQVRARGEVWRLLTAGWVHKDLMHLAFNMITLYFFAGQVANVLGAAQFLILYISAVAVGFIPTTLRRMNEPGYNVLGASGAVAAVMFSAILLHPKMKLMLMFLPIPVSGPVFAVVYLAYSAWNSYGSRDGVDHTAHFAGAIYGVLLTYLFEPARVERTIKMLM